MTMMAALQAMGLLMLFLEYENMHNYTKREKLTLLFFCFLPSLILVNLSILGINIEDLWK